MFQPAGRVSGSDGCNRIAGRYQIKGDAVTFSQILGTQMACIDAGDTERAFRDALNGAVRLTRAGDRMELIDAAGKRLAAFAAGAPAPAPAPPTGGLEGTSWRPEFERLALSARSRGVSKHETL